MKIKKGDTVIVITGKDKGKKGKVLLANPKENKVIVEGVAMRKKHLKPKTTNSVGEIVTRESAINASNVQLVDPKTGKGTRIGSKIVGDKKVRIAKKSGQEI